MTRSLKFLSMLNVDRKLKMSSEQRIQEEATKQDFSSRDSKGLVCRPHRKTDSCDREAAAS